MITKWRFIVVLVLGGTIAFSGLCWAQSAEEYFDQGQSLFSQRKLDQAVEAFQKALEVDPTFGLAYLEIGFAYRLKGDFEKAEEAYLKALDINPDEAGAYLRLGEVYNLMKDEAAAEKAFEAYRAMTTKPTNP